MDQTIHFTRFAFAIRSLQIETVRSASDIPASFLLAQDGALTCHYIPFDRVNQAARIVLVGITPGFTQWRNAVQEAQRQLNAGSPMDVAHSAAKRTGAFSGAMRPNLIAMLNHIGLHEWLGLESAAALFDTAGHLVQTTSILRHPVFVNGGNYNGTPKMERTHFLQQQILEHFSQEAKQLPDAIFVPLGPRVSEGLEWLAHQKIISRDRILHGLPHPSGANAERIAYFLGRKKREDLSGKTDASKLDAVRADLIARVQRFRTAS